MRWRLLPSHPTQHSFCCGNGAFCAGTGFQPRICKKTIIANRLTPAARLAAGLKARASVQKAQVTQRWVPGRSPRRSRCAAISVASPHSRVACRHIGGQDALVICRPICGLNRNSPCCAHQMADRREDPRAARSILPRLGGGARPDARGPRNRPVPQALLRARLTPARARRICRRCN
jgi:hypothetical protein